MKVQINTSELGFVLGVELVLIGCAQLNPRVWITGIMVLAVEEIVRSRFGSRPGPWCSRPPPPPAGWRIRDPDGARRVDASRTD
jgi:hypothetical protein